MTQTGAQSINLKAGGPKDDLHFGWTEWAGRKSTTVPIVFPHPFPSTPVVTLGLVGLFATQGSEAFAVEADNITPRGFNLVFTTSSQDSTSMVKFQWLATDA